MAEMTFSTVCATFQPSTLFQSRRGSITAVAHLSFRDGFEFPSAGWNDFVVVIASWWIDALVELRDGSAEVELRFMDGPYFVRVAQLGGGLLRLRCVEAGGEDGKIVGEFTVRVDELTREIVALATRVSGACEESGIESSDLRDLRRALRAL